MTALPPDFDFTVNSFMQLTFNSNFNLVMAAAQEVEPFGRLMVRSLTLCNE